MRSGTPRALFENLRNRLVNFDGIPCPGRQRIFCRDDSLDALKFGRGNFGSVGERFLPFGQANIQHVARRNISAQQIYKAGRGLFAKNIGFGHFLRISRDEADRIFPDKQAGQQKQRGDDAVKIVLANQRGHARVFQHAQMRLIKDDLPIRSDQPGEQVGMPFLAHGLIAQEIGIRREHDHAGTKFALDDDRVLVAGINPTPAGMEIRENHAAVPGKGFGWPVESFAPGQHRFETAIFALCQLKEGELNTPALSQTDPRACARDFARRPSLFSDRWGWFRPSSGGFFVPS